MIHPQIRGLLRMMSAAKIKPMEQMTPAEAREFTEAGAKANIAERPSVYSINDLTMPGSDGDIRLRVYKPSNDSSLPGIVFFHGGGHVVGSLDSEDVTARLLCRDVNAIVVSVDYRLAPEHKFPAAVNDAYDATRWVVENSESLGIDLNRFGLAGDSSGANLALVVSIMARNEKRDIEKANDKNKAFKWPDFRLQAFIYPIVDFSLSDPTYEQYASGFGVISRNAIHWFRTHYLKSDEDIEDWRASPLKEKDFSGLPPVFMVSAENDCLKGEGLRLTDALRNAGVPVERHEYEGMIHTFFVMYPTVASSVKAQEEVCTAFRNAFAVSG